MLHLSQTSVIVRPTILEMDGFLMDWDELARRWLEAAPNLEASFGEVFRALFDAANLKSREAVLDVGCGTGPTLVAAAETVGEAGRLSDIDVAPPLAARI